MMSHTLLDHGGSCQSVSSPLSDLERFAFESADLRKTLEAVFPEFQFRVVSGKIRTFFGNI